jgi:steroid 5-alpha reductase family enzyme
MMFAVAEAAFWPVQAVAGVVIAAVLGALFRYLWLARQRRGNRGGADALVWGLAVLALDAVVAALGSGISWPAAGVGALLVAGGIHARRAGRRRS